MSPPRSDDDLDVVPKRVEKTEKPVGGETAKPSTNEIRDARLVDPENFGRPCLRQPSLLDDQGDSGCDLRLDEQLGALRKSNVFKDVSAAPFDGGLRGRPPIRRTCSSSH